MTTERDPMTLNESSAPAEPVNDFETLAIAIY